MKNINIKKKNILKEKPPFFFFFFFKNSLLLRGGGGTHAPKDPLIKCFCLFTYTSGLIEDKICRIFFVVVDLLSLKLLMFRLIILERSECTR